MSALPDVKKLVQQTQRYEFTDGLRDLQWALMMTAMGLTFWLIFDHAYLLIPFARDLSAQFGILGNWIFTIVVIGIPSLVPLAVWVIMRLLRKRWLWRESGYVQPKAWFVPRRVMFISATIVFIVIAAGIVLQITTQRSDLFFMRLLLVGSGWSFGYTLAEMGRRLDFPRYVRVGAAASLLTALLLVLPLSVGVTGLLWGVVWGLALALSSVGPLRAAMQAAQVARHE